MPVPATRLLLPRLVLRPGADAAVSGAELAAFVRDHFFKDAQLARQHPACSKAYWVSAWMGGWMGGGGGVREAMWCIVARCAVCSVWEGRGRAGQPLGTADQLGSPPPPQPSLPMASPTSVQVGLARLVLKRLLLLVALLDRAATAAGLPAGAPLLFRTSAAASSSSSSPLVKSSAAMLAEGVQARLAGEGDLVRTLARLGYRVAHCQDPRREVDFRGGWACGWAG